MKSKTTMTDSTAPMETGSSINVSAGDQRAEMDKMRAELVAEKAKNQRLEKKSEAIDLQRKEALKGMQADIEGFVTSLQDENPDHKFDMAPIATWAKSCHEMSDPEHQIPLARALSCASAKVKRTLDQASAQSSDAETLGKTMKELEEVKADVQKRTKRESEFEEHIRDLNKRNTELDDLIKKHGITTAKFDFSKIASRETAPPAGASDSPSAASRMDIETGASSANPISAAASNQEEPGLLGFLMSGGRGASSFMPSAREGHWLAATTGGPLM